MSVTPSREFCLLNLAHAGHGEAVHKLYVLWDPELGQAPRLHGLIQSILHVLRAHSRFRHYDGLGPFTPPLIGDGNDGHRLDPGNFRNPTFWLE